MAQNTLHQTLELLYQTYQNDYLSLDPLEMVRQFSRPKDQETAAFIAAGLAIGHAGQIRKAVSGVLAVMQPSPYDFAAGFDPERDARLFDGFVYRFYRGRDIGLLIAWISEMIRQSGSIGQFFLQYYREEEPDIGNSLSRFIRAVLRFNTHPFYARLPDRGAGIRHFLADPADGSACKRLNLFLRWMVRRDTIDLGLWPGIHASKLVIPLDIHISRFGRFLGLTRRSSPGWSMAMDITDSLRQFDPADPVKYDFAICTLGKLSDCEGHPARVKCLACPVFRFCTEAVS